MKSANEHLTSLLAALSIRRENPAAKILLAERPALVEYLVKEFPVGKFLVAQPFHIGSWEKKTAIAPGFDLDLMLLFRHDSGAPKKVKRLVLHAVERYARSPWTVRDQRVSAGLRMMSGAAWVRIDVVAGVEWQAGAFQQGNTAVRLFDRELATDIHTNVHKQMQALAGEHKEIQRRMMRLLKWWRMHHNISWRSFELEAAVMQAYRHATAPKGEQPAGHLEFVMNWLAAFLDARDLIDPGTGKPLSGGLSVAARSNLAGRLRRSLQLCKQHATGWEQQFPLP